MKKLIIVGAGGFGREVFSWCGQAQSEKSDWCLTGFLDGNPDALNDYDYGIPIVGNPMAHLPGNDEVFVCAIGEPTVKMNVCSRLEGLGAHFITLIHPSAVMGHSATIGKGCVLCPGTVITADVKLGNHVIVNACASVGHDAVIGDGCTLSSHSDVTGFARLGRGVFLGSHASILPKAKVGDFATVGAGSVVLRSVKPGATVMGVPAIQVGGFASSAKKGGS